VLLVAFSFAGVAYGPGSAGPHAGNSYGRKTYDQKAQKDRLNSAKYHKNLHSAKKHADASRLAKKDYKTAAHKNAFNNYNAAARKNRLNKKLALNAVNAKKNRIAFKKHNNNKKDLYNNLKYRNNLKSAHTRAANNLHRNKKAAKNANLKKAKFNARHSEYDVQSDDDWGAAGHGYKGSAGMGSAGAGPRHSSKRKHGQNHNFGNAVVKSNYNQFANDRYGKKSRLDQGLKDRKLAFAKVNAAKRHNQNALAYAAAKDKYNKRNKLAHLNRANEKAALRKKNALSNAHMTRANQLAKARKHALANYKKKNATGFATRSAHAYAKKNANQKGISNKMV
jgi:hypothetical protein